MYVWDRGRIFMAVKIHEEEIKSDKTKCLLSKRSYCINQLLTRYMPFKLHLKLFSSCYFLDSVKVFFQPFSLHYTR